MQPPLVIGVLASFFLSGGAGLHRATLAPDNEVRRALALVRELRDAAPAAVLKGLAEVRTQEALDALLEAANHLTTPAALQLVYGLVATYCSDREFAEPALAALEREALGPNPGRWLPATEGLVAAGDTAIDALGRVFERSTDAAARAESGAGRSIAQFYGIPLTSNRVAFVIDASGSMSAGTGSHATGAPAHTRIEVAKSQLLAVVGRLEPRARFNIVWFATDTSAWRARLAERTPANLRSAQRFVEERRADGATALYDGLVAAWRDRDVEAIYLLSDGTPSAGRLVQPEAILADVRARFASKPVTVHCISVGTASSLLEAIAGATGGMYRVID